MYSLIPFYNVQKYAKVNFRIGGLHSQALNSQKRKGLRLPWKSKQR